MVNAHAKRNRTEAREGDLIPIALLVPGDRFTYHGGSFGNVVFERIDPNDPETHGYLAKVISGTKGQFKPGSLVFQRHGSEKPGKPPKIPDTIVRISSLTVS